MAQYTALDVSLFSLGKSGQATSAWAQFVGTLKNATVKIEDDTVDSRGIAGGYEIHQTVKQGTTIDFTTFADPSGDDAPVDNLSNLSVTAWAIGGTAYLADIRSGSINVTNPVKERSSIGALNKFPVFAGGTAVEVQCSKIVSSTAIFTSLLATGTIANFLVTVSITYGGLVYTAPMVLSAASYKVERGEIQMEDVTLKLAGTPTGPVDTSLLGAVLTDDLPYYGVAFNGGASSFGTTVDGSGAPTQYAVMTKLNVTFADGAIIEQSGTLEVQGAI